MTVANERAPPSASLDASIPGEAKIWHRGCVRPVKVFNPAHQNRNYIDSK